LADDQEPDRTGVAILDAALRVLVDFGVKRATVEQVAKYAGVSHMTVYRRWPAKNELLLTAGFAAAYGASSLTDPALAPVRTAVVHVLRGHMPYPAVVIDRFGEVVEGNNAMDVLTVDVAPELLEAPVNIYRLALHPRGMAPRIVNFGQWAHHVVERLKQESVRNPSDRLAALYDELAGYVPQPVVTADHVGFAVPLQLRTPYGELRLLTTITTFATAVDVTVAELKLEAFLPADQTSATLLGRWPR